MTFEQDVHIVKLFSITSKTFWKSHGSVRFLLHWAHCFLNEFLIVFIIAQLQCIQGNEIFHMLHMLFCRVLNGAGFSFEQ